MDSSDSSALPPHLQPSVESTVFNHVVPVLGYGRTLNDVATSFFSGIHLRMPFICRRTFESCMPTLSEESSAEYTLLSLAMYLVEQPALSKSDGRSETYATVKQMLGLLDAAGYHGLGVIQCRILVIVYETGHGILEAASISSSACTRAARWIGLGDVGSTGANSAGSSVESEERKRSWWAIYLLDRFVNMCAKDAMFGMPDANLTDRLPCADRLWLQDQLSPFATIPSLDSPFDADFGQFARECQIANLAGRVCRHVFEPTGDIAFHSAESAQLERTLLAYLPLLDKLELMSGRFCGALAIACRYLERYHAALYPMLIHKQCTVRFVRVWYSQTPTS
jgi:hypothetical protein